MTDLVEFLQARLDDDAEAAEAAGNRRWLVQDNIIELYPEREDDGFMSWPTRADARHAARWEPARVLREVEAKRKVLNAYTAQVAEVQRISVLRDAEVAKAGEDSLTVAELIGTGLRVGSWINPLEWVLRIMATVYADHPDYREDWKP